MIVADLLAHIQAAGGTVEPHGDRLRVRAPEPLQDVLLGELRTHKAAVLAHLRSVVVDLPAAVTDWPADWQERFEERAAIMEYDAGLPRPDAERRAEELVRAVYRQVGCRT